MASKNLTDNQGKLNDLLKSYDYKTFRYDDYDNDPLAQELLKKILDTELFASTKLLLWIQNELKNRKIEKLTIIR